MRRGPPPWRLLEGGLRYDTRILLEDETKRRPWLSSRCQVYVFGTQRVIVLSWMTAQYLLT